MECQRLQKLVKSWYVQVQDEAMAPARMVAFMENHIAGCHICLADPEVHDEVAKITEIVLPPSKARIGKTPSSEEPKEQEEEENVDDDESSDDNDDDEEDELDDDDEI